MTLKNIIDNYECFCLTLVYYTLLCKIMTPRVQLSLVIGIRILMIQSYLVMNWYLFVQNIITYYPEAFEIKDIADAPKRYNYLEVRLEFDESRRLYTRLYET